MASQVSYDTGCSACRSFSGGDKRTQERDIRQARQYWNDYQQRESK